MLQELSSTSDTLPNPQILRLKQLLSGVAECVKGNGGLTLLGLFETLCTHPRLQVPNSGPWKWVLCEAATFPALPQLLGIPVLPSNGTDTLQRWPGSCWRLRQADATHRTRHWDILDRICAGEGDGQEMPRFRLNHQLLTRAQHIKPQA